MAMIRVINEPEKYHGTARYILHKQNWPSTAQFQNTIKKLDFNILLRPQNLFADITIVKKNIHLDEKLLRIYNNKDVC